MKVSLIKYLKEKSFLKIKYGLMSKAQKCIKNIKNNFLFKHNLKIKKTFL